MCDFARQHPRLGYERLSWQMVAEAMAYLRSHQVYAIVQTHDLLHRWRIRSPTNGSSASIAPIGRKGWPTRCCATTLTPSM
ncbi:MAG: hypothetical protein U0768_19350 [Anaerolineae bacterium]